MAGNEKSVRMGTGMTHDGTGDRASRMAQGGEITSNGVFTKILRDGKVEVVPTSEIYAKEADERVEGIEVNDPTVLRAAGLSGGSLQDRAEREFNTQERGDAVSKQHAQGAAGTIGREPPVPVKLEKGAYEKELKAQEEEHQARREEAAEEGEAAVAEAESKREEEEAEAAAARKSATKAPAKKASAKKKGARR